ncbi:hypothetical protein ACA910_017520 [Epithemia clementina (nom. ined.)]
MAALSNLVILHLFAAFLFCSGFTPNIRYSSCRENIGASLPRRSRSLLSEPNKDNLSESGDSSSPGAAEEQDETVVAPSGSSFAQAKFASQQKQLDPLVRSLTRIDPQTAEAPAMQIPFVGELVLDRSLFVLLPVATFAVLGCFLALYIGLNAGDAFVELEQAATQGQKAAVDLSDEACRGLCSDQAQDLEELRNFMSNFGKI